MNYTILRQIDSGGFANVYEVADENGVRFAMKELKFPNTVNAQRFNREVGILSTLSHPNIVRIFDWNLTPQSGKPFYIMELLSGGSLRNVMTNQFRSGVFSRKWTINEVMLPICSALAAAQMRGIFHKSWCVTRF